MQAMETGDFLEHYGVKGMKWGVIRSKEQRQANRAARAETRIAVRKVEAKGIDKTDAGIAKARKELADAERRAADARDRYKVDKHTMNKIDAKRPMKVAVADLRRIRENASHLTEDEQFALDMMDAGRALKDAFFVAPEKRRDAFQKAVDTQRDKQRILDEAMKKV